MASSGLNPAKSSQFINYMARNGGELSKGFDLVVLGLNSSSVTGRSIIVAQTSYIRVQDRKNNSLQNTNA